MSRQLQENTMEYQDAYRTLKAINEQLNDMETMEDVKQFIDDASSISVIHDIYDTSADGFIIDITVNGPYISLNTVENVIKYDTMSGHLEWSPRFEKTQLIDDYINDYLYQA